MYDDGSIPPMSPDDFAAFAAFAGPLYQQSKTIESYCSESPIPNVSKDYGSNIIRQGLEQAKSLAQASALRQQQSMYVPPADPVFLAEAPYAPPVQQFTQAVSNYHEPILQISDNCHTSNVIHPTQRNDGQLEFSFEKKEQQVTNDLLKEISGKLSKLLKILEPEGLDKPERQATIPKSNPTPKHVRPTQTKQTST